MYVWTDSTEALCDKIKQGYNFLSFTHTFQEDIKSNLDSLSDKCEGNNKELISK